MNKYILKILVPMNPIPLLKRKSFYISIILFLVLIGGLHLFIVNRANVLLPGLVKNLTKGKYELKIQKLKFRYWDASIDMQGVHMFPITDSLKEEYHVQLSSIHLRLHSIISLITGKDIKVLELEIKDPAVEVKRNEKLTKHIKRSELHILIGELQNSSVHFLRALKVEKCSVTNATFKYYPEPQSLSHYNISHINIRLSDVHVDKAKSELAGKIVISVLEPGLKLPDSLKHIQLDKFIWDNQRDLVDVGRFVISQKGKKNLSDSTKVELEALTIKKLYWKEWLQTGIVHIDSLLTENGNMYFSIAGTTAKRKPRDSVDLRKLKVWDVIGNLNIGYFSARKINASIINTEPGVERDNTILGDSLVISHLNINPGKKNPLSLEDLAIGVQSFVDKGKGKKFHTSFTGLRLKGDTLSLKNYEVKTTLRSRFGVGTMLYIPLIRMVGLSVRDIIEKKATIREIWMENPKLTVKGTSFGQKKLGNNMPANAFEELKSYVDVQKVFISNGSLEYLNQESGQRSIQMKNFNTTILARKLMSSSKISDALNGLINTSIGSLHYSIEGKNIGLSHLILNYGSGVLKIGSADVVLDQLGLNAKVQGLNMQIADGFNPFLPSNKWHFKLLQLDSGFVNLSPRSEKGKESVENKIQKRNYFFDSLDIHQLKLHLVKNKWNLDARLFHFHSSQLNVSPELSSWSLLTANVGDVHFNSNEIEILINRAEINPMGKSLFKECNIFRESDAFSLKASLPHAITGTGFRDSKFKPLAFDFLGLTKPTIEIFLNDVVDPEIETEKQKNIFSLGSLMVDDPRLFVTLKTKDENISLGTTGERIRGKGLSLLGGRKISGFFMDQLSASLGASEVNTSARNIFRTGFIDFDINEINKGGVMPWQFSIKKFNVGSFKLNRVRERDTIEFRTGGVYLGEIPKLIIQKDSILNTVFKLPPAEILPSTFIFRNEDKALGIFNLTANTKEEFLKWDSLSFRNRLSREDFFKSIPFEKDYITLSTGKVNAEILRPVIYNDDTTVFVHRLTIDPLEFKVERDKRIKDDTVKYRPLLARSLKKIPFPFRIDSIELRRSTIWHSLIDEKTGKEGTIFFKDVDGQLSLVKNFDYQENDSLAISLDSKLMGQGDLKFIFRQDYNDSLQTFLLNAKMGHLDMKEMNRLLQPLQNVRVDKGVISDLGVKVKGNNVLAYGSMDMLYDDLTVSVLRDNGKRNGFQSWLANVFLKSSNARTGIIYTERSKEKAIFNFWGKIAINGLLTNLGVKKNSKQEKRFYRGLQKHQLPEDVF